MNKAGEEELFPGPNPEERTLRCPRLESNQGSRSIPDQRIVVDRAAGRCRTRTVLFTREGASPEATALEPEFSFGPLLRSRPHRGAER